MKNRYPKKYYGQNFLKNESILKNIFEHIKNIEPNIFDTIIEIGPGYGALTKYIIELKSKLICLEIDRDLIRSLQLKFAKANIINIDALEYNFDTTQKDTDYIVVGNIPYYITGSILRKLIIETQNQPKYIIFMMQKEIADKITNKKSSKLSILIESFGTVVYKTNISKYNFYPIPKVESSMIFIKKDRLYDTNKRFWKFINIAFSSPRKMLINNLSNIYDKTKTLEILSKLNIAPATRPENLNITHYIELYKNILTM